MEDMICRTCDVLYDYVEWISPWVWKIAYFTVCADKPICPMCGADLEMAWVGTAFDFLRSLPTNEDH